MPIIKILADGIPDVKVLVGIYRIAGNFRSLLKYRENFVLAVFWKIHEIMYMYLRNFLLYCISIGGGVLGRVGGSMYYSICIG